MSYEFYEIIQDHFQGLDYVFSAETNQLIMLPHGNSDGQMSDRAGTIVTEEFVLKIADIIANTISLNYEISRQEISILVAPCYPNAVRKQVKRLEVLGDWDTPTWAAQDAIGMSFIIKSHDCTVRPDWTDC